MADDLDVLRREIERKSSELESLKNLLALKVSTVKRLQNNTMRTCREIKLMYTQ